MQCGRLPNVPLTIATGPPRISTPPRPAPDIAPAAARFVLAQPEGVLAPDDAFLRPVELVRARLVRDPVAVGVPERAGLEHHDLPPAACQPLGQGAAAGPGPDDRQ